MVSPVVVDGRLTREKLDELLALGAEHAELDFKATLDLTRPGHRLGLVKDLIAMSNAGSGGYVVVGVNEDGTVATGVPAVDATQFDSADLAQQIGRHVVTAPVVTSQMHEVDGRNLVLIHVAPPVSHLPAIISRSGEYADGKRMKVVLVEGVLYIERERIPSPPRTGTGCRCLRDTGPALSPRRAKALTRSLRRLSTD